MSDPMIERIAKIISPDRCWGGHVGRARTILAAMRTPTEDMISAGTLKVITEDVWRAMIDAALR